MQERIYQLLYLSSSSQIMEDEELFTLLESSRKNNKRRDITGFLLYNDGNIIQLLEGKKESVEELFLIIARDMRHYGIIKLFEGFGEKRDFPDWSMGFKRLLKEEVEGNIEGVNHLLMSKDPQSDEFKNISKKVRLFINSFRKTSSLI